MKLVKKIAFGAFALAASGALFFSCSNAAGDSNALTSTTTQPAQTTQTTQTTQGGGTGQTQSPATISYNEVWSGSQKIDWGANGVSIDHAKFTADFDSLRVTYNASAGAIKLSVCDPWTDITLTAASVSDGTIADDGAFNLPTGDNKTVTIKLSDADVTGIKGQNKDGAWGGVKIYGADTVTLLKVESFKAAASATTATPAPQPQPQPQPQTQTPATPTYTEVWTGSTQIAWSINESGEFVSADKLSNAKGLRVTFTTDDASSHCMKFLQGDDWKDIALSSVEGSGSLADSSAGNDAGKAVYLWANQTTGATVSIYWVPGSEDATKVLAKGIKVYGDGATLTKIEVIK